MTPAVVVGGVLTALGVVRSLASAGIPVYLVCDTRFCPAGFSRHCTLLRVPDLEGPGLIDGLLSIAGQIGEKAVLILSSDLQVLAVSRARAALEAHFFLALPTDTMVDVLMDKAKFQAYAEEIGLRVPRAVVLDAGHDEQTLDVLSMPVVLKPVDRALVLAGVARTTRADTVAEARAVARRMRCVDSSVVVQEWIDGDDVDIYFTLFVCDRQGGIVALFTGRKMICEPPLVGCTALCVAATEEHRALAAKTEAFVKHSHYHGIGGLEFKRHRRTGQFVVVEPTVGRPDWQEEIATLCGVNIPAIAYRTVLGEPVESVGPIDPAVAWRASIRYRPRAGTLPPGTRIVDGHFRLTDPLPGLYSVAHCCVGAARAALPSFGGRDLRPRRSPVIQTSTIGGERMQLIDTAIIGAGPYGLSVAAHLRVAGVPHEIFGEPLESWQSFMPQGMVLKSEPFASNLWDPARRFTYENFLAEKNITYRRVGDPIPVERFVEYGQWFHRHAVDEVRRVKVRHVARTDGAYWLELEDGTVSKARRVVLATGHMGFRNVPDELKGLPEGMCLHSTALHDLRQFAGRDVTVIGAGASALESLALLHEAGAKTRLVARRKQITWNPPTPDPSLIERLRAPEAGLGAGWRSWAVSELPFLYRRMFEPAKRHQFFLNSWGPAGAWWLRDRVEGNIDLLLGHQIASAEVVDGRVRLGLTGPAGATEILTEHVVAGTGFDAALERIDCLEPTLRAQIAREGPYPRLSAHFETSVKGLFIVGLAAAPVFGPVQRFMFGAKHAAPAVTRALRRSRTRDAIDRVPAARASGTARPDRPPWWPARTGAG